VNKIFNVSNIDNAVLFNKNDDELVLLDLHGIIQLFVKLREERIRVLGGDVYYVSNGMITLSYDNWSVDRCVSDLESIDASLEYILCYENSNNGNYLYSLVLKNSIGDNIKLSIDNN